MTAEHRRSARPLPGRGPADLTGQVLHGSRSRPMVALTFHGQGEPALAEEVLAVAEQAGARLTVMAVGSWLDDHPAIASRIRRGGHDLGNHTQHHPDICAMDGHDALREIEACAERLLALTGTVGPWFRPSRRALATPLVQRLARRAGYAHCLSYDVDSLDYTDPGPAAVRRTVLGTVRPGSIVSMHLGHVGTLEALPGILDGLRRRGLQAVSATRMLQLPDAGVHGPSLAGIGPPFVRTDMS
ncbi:polysaccharide deacetylase family protein [Actinacidiphila paucisporea]|uniref:Peptidoglycan/xylan/chitin deacetylase, PgdA/CDA1 family n=1 Tax=Actinacidiphila paucisporea TaxID=310782 RepID=A0A1M7QAJ2_9ACTN|nr:polysaccharide deacetylase family protein [Actinacidiphila paucisporea]SHN27535.1 Peptidoglycan/xylan/chitin deacetylase, PgdA/CDA1 family [Actinacidiphila paucisporea]